MNTWMAQLKRQAVTLEPNELVFVTQFNYCSFDWIKPFTVE